MRPTEYEIQTYEGRNICGAAELKGGYMGCGSLENHVAQMRDPDSWVHSSKDRWLKAYKRVNGGSLPDFLGKPLAVGDQVVYIQSSGRCAACLRIGTVVRFTKCYTVVQPNNTTDPKYCVKVAEHRISRVG